MDYRVDLVFSATAVVGVKADSAEEAAEKAYQSDKANPTLCHHCAREVDIGDCYRAVVSDENGEQVLDDGSEQSQINQLNAQLQAAQAEAEKYKWQPIETAPKDGRTILLGKYNQRGMWRTIRGQYFSKEVIESEWENGEDCNEGWYEASVECPDDINCWWIDSPTHWMPLPAAPAMKEV